MKLIALLFLLSSCAELRHGWVRVDFMEGKPSEFVVCQLKLEGDDMVAKCVDLDTVERRAKQREAEKHEGEI